MRMLCDVTFSYWNKYHSSPTVHSLREEIKLRASRDLLSEPTKLALFALCDELSTMDISESAYLNDRVAHFSKVSALSETAIALVTAAENYKRSEDEHEFQEVLQKMRDIQSIGTSQKPSFDLVASAANLPSIISASAHYSSKMRIPTGFRALDHSLGGGLGAGEIAFIAAPPGAGKSTLLTQFAAGAILGQANVMVFTMELKQEDYGLRLMQRLCGVTKDHIAGNSLRWRERFEWANEQLRGKKVIFKYFPPGRATVDSLRSSFSKDVAHHDNGRPWVIIVDYVEKLRLMESRTLSNHDLIGYAVDELIAMGDEFEAPVISASQINRQGFRRSNTGSGRRVNTNDDIAASWKKVEAADLLLTFNQTPAEKAGGIARIHLNKSRRGEDGWSFPVLDQRPIMNMVELEQSTGNQVQTYSPYFNDDYLEPRPDWSDQAEPFEDESLEGKIRPPQLVLNDWLTKQILTIQESSNDYTVDDARRDFTQRTGQSIAGGGPVAGMDNLYSGIDQIMRGR
jgi:replicative DNA helicase